MLNHQPSDNIVSSSKRIPDREDQIAAEKIRLVFQHAPMAIAINPVVGVLMVVIDWEYVPHHVLWGWLVIFLFAVFIRAYIWFQYRKRQPSIFESRQWGKLFAMAMAGSGLAWGSSAVFLFPPGEIVPQLVIVALTAGLTAGAMASSATYLPLFYSYLFPALIPVIVVFFVQGTTFHTAIGLASFMYLAVLAKLGRANYLSFEELIDLRIEIEIQKDNAERANIAKSKFLAAASHDLRQPLHALSLHASTLDKHVYDNKESRLVMERINRSVNDLEQLFSALLDISKLDAQVIKPRFEAFPLKRIINSLESDWLELAHEKGIEWQRDGDVEGVIVYSDQILLVRILGNLISNAVKYTDSGKVTIGVETSKAGVEIYVADTGSGIPADKQETIFQEFVQLHNPQRNRDLGLGLGLAIVKRLVDLLECPITIKSVSGKGSRFSLLLPYGDAEQVNASDVNLIQQIIGGFNNMLVLVIDDEENIRSGMKSILENWDCRVMTAASCREAILSLDDTQQIPELILADYRLKNNENGVDAITAIRHYCGNDIPALIITGDVASEQLTKLDIEGYTVLHKPVAPARLRLSMQQLIKPRDFANTV